MMAAGRGDRGGRDDAGPPLDRRVDRREFLARVAAITAAAAGGAALDVPGARAMPAREHGRVATVPSAGPQRQTGAPPGGVRWSPGAYAARLRPEALTDPAEATIAEAAALIRDRKLSPAELVEACLARIERLDSVYRAFNYVAAREARATAERLGRMAATGPLHGIPLAVKDVFFTDGMPTTANSLLFQDYVPAYDATVVARLRREGAIVIGKTQTGPLATTRATTPAGEVTTVNAWAPDSPGISPGGSSSGSATAVAARLATSSLGTQTRGSIVGPASAQGLTGIKPTVGLVSLHGVIPLSYTRDAAGPIARDALDAAIVLQAIAGTDPADPRTAETPEPPDYVRAATPVETRGRPALRWPTTIGVFVDRGTGVAGAGSSDRDAMLATFETLGARVVEIRKPDGWDELTRVFDDVRLVERAEMYLPHLRRDVRDFGVSLSAWINGLLIGGDAYLKGQRARLLLLRRVLDEVFGACDVVVLDSPLTFDFLGLPQITFPIGLAGPEHERLPVGAILGGPPFGEERLLSLVAAYQAISDWHRLRPPEPANGARDRGRIRAEQVLDTSE